ncbi:MAG: flagellar basal body-associated FliL family protein [Planctomycetota bacterium]|jgi:flagellar basal body-associated protein FliL
MADDKKTQDNAKVEDSSEPKETATKIREDENVEDSSEPKQTAAKIGFVTWAILVVFVVFCAGSGFLLARLLAGPDKPQTQSSKPEESVSPKNPEVENSQKNSEKSWYYDLEPVMANLDEPGVTRYVQVTITLEISSALEQGKGEKLLEERKPILTNWLTIYLAGLTLEDTRGDRNLKRIQSQVLDAFNERLFPDAKPQIKHILFKEFAIQ